MVVSTSMMVMAAIISIRVKPRAADSILSRFLKKRLIAVAVAFPEKEAQGWAWWARQDGQVLLRGPESKVL